MGEVRTDCNMPLKGEHHPAATAGLSNSEAGTLADLPLGRTLLLPPFVPGKQGLSLGEKEEV